MPPAGANDPVRPMPRHTGRCTPRVLVPLRSTAWASPPTHRLPKSHASHSGERPVRPYIRLPSVRPVFSLSFRAQSADWAWESVPPRPQARNLQSLPCVKGGVARRATEKLLSPGGAEARPYTRLPIAFAPSVRADVGIRPYEITGGVCVIRTGGQSPRAPTTAYRQQKHFPNQRPKAATYLCRFAAKARFDNRPHPRRVFPKREGRSPPSLVAQGWGIFKGEGRSKLPSPLNGAFGYFCRY